MTHPLAYLLNQEPLIVEAGDRMDRTEFMSRWERMPNLKFAELIDGVVYLPSPVSFEHGHKVQLLNGWAALYAGRAGVVEGATNATVFVAESAPQPDVALRIKPEYGGRSRIVDQYPEGPPEFVAEVSRSSRSYDLGPKLELYERAGVGEYLAALLEEQRLEWRVLRNERYQLMAADSAGVFRSEVLPGLWLEEPAFWANDMGAMLSRLEEGMASVAFREFLQSRKALG
jgi:Uma2 family endonuclease